MQEIFVYICIKCYTKMFLSVIRKMKVDLNFNLRLYGKRFNH